MNVVDIITGLKRSKVVPLLEGTQLRLVGETKNLSEEFLLQVKAHKEELITFLRNATDQSAIAPIPAIVPAEHYAASNAQQRLWVLSQFDGGAAAYNIVTSFYLKGEVIFRHLNLAFQLSVQRHESLRTVFSEVNGDLVQLVRPSIPFELEYEDISQRADKRQYLIAASEEPARWNFDLVNGPLLRVRLLKLSEGEHALIFGIHHIVSDGRSISVLIREVMHNYELLCLGKEPLADTLRIQYKDYTSWLADRIEGPKGEAAKTFWKKHFEAVPEPLSLPYNFPRPAVKNYEGAFSRFYMEPELFNNIHAFCQKAHVTTFNFFRSALTLLLYKVSGQQHIVTGTPVSGRNHFDLEEQVGLYVNTLPLSIEVDPEQSFRTFLSEVSDNSFRAFEFQDYPLDRIIEELDVKRDIGRSPLFDVMIVLQNAGLGDGTIGFSKQYGFELSLLGNYLYPSAELRADEKRGAKFDLSFYFDHEPDNTFVIEIEYAVSLFKKERVAVLYNAFLEIIRQAIAQPEIRVADIGIVGSELKAKLLTSFNKPVASIEEPNVLTLLKTSFSRHNTAPALITGEGMMTYADLGAASDRLAAHISSLMEEKDLFVGMLMDRTPWMVICMLAILKAGKAYVPVDPAYPAGRIDYIINDAAPAVLLIDEKGASLVPATYQGQVISISAITADVAGNAIGTNDLREQTAYLIYTSGSTGQPKGVEISHRNVTAFLKWADETFAQTPYDILYATTSYCFDLSVFEIFLPLIQGKTIRLLRSALEIPSFITTDPNVLINTVPSVVNTLLDQGMPWSNVVALNMAGEPIPRKIIHDLKGTRMEIRNLYGPSEDTTYSTMYRFGSADDTLIPIGKPVGYTQLYILDKHLHMLPPGVEGEIFLSGQSVAKGYYGKPGLTAEKFLHSPFLEDFTMYRTGDVGYWLPDGNVMFTGRADDQVKVRGYRIEPGEIQYVLEQHPAVHRATVLIREVNGEKDIVAYYTGDAETGLKEYLGALLPAYMIPAYWVKLDEIPLNSNGKVDKKRLPLPFTDAGETAVVPPENAVQQALLELWETVLQRKGFGIKDNFFSLGGHSLKAARLRSFIAKDLQKELSLNEIFAHPTIAAQAQLIEGRAVQQFREITPTAEKEYYPISFAQERLWVLTKFRDASRAYNMPAAFHIKGLLDIERMEHALRLVVEKHESLRTIFLEKDGVPVQRVLESEAVNLDVEQISITHALSSAAITSILQNKWHEPFDMEKGPLMACFILHTPESSILSFNMHHIISDGWSVAVLYKEVMTAYFTGSLGAPQLQYRDFAIWQQAQLTGERLEKLLNYWTGVFKDEISPLEFPSDFPRPAVKTYEGQVHKIAIGADLTSLAATSDVSLFMVLLAGVNVLLKKYTDQQDIVTGTPVAGRDNPQLQDQIGFYVNTLPLRIRLNADESFSALLLRVKELVLEGISNQDLPFEMLVEQLPLKRDMSRSPLFDVMVVLQNIDGLDLSYAQQEMPRLQLEKLNIPSGTAKYDLTFTFIPEGDKLQLELEYNTGLFSGDTAAQIAIHLQRVFEQVKHDPAVTLKNISLLDDAEKKLLSSKADQTHVGYDRHATINSLFHEAVIRFPDRTAVQYGALALTYRELDQRSGQLAYLLVNRYKVAPEELVVLHFERSEWMLIGILAVLKAGAAYVPVDPAYPQARINYITGDSGSKLILSDASAVTTIQDITVVDITTLEYTADTLEVPVQANNLAYVIYTSGTTGNPKGVLIEHGNVTRLLFNENDLFDFNYEDRWTLFHSYCFDFSVWEMYGALLKGGTVVIVPKEVAQDSIAFYDFLEKEKITVLNQTPTAFRSLVHNNHRHFSHHQLAVRYLIFGGEALMPEILREWQQHFPACRNINMYGITETTVHVTFKEITIAEITANRSNIGLPIPTLSAYVLDAALQQVPVGVIGELCIGGAGVARGYLNRPDLTVEKFIPHPERPGEKLYRSGDYARILPSGDIEYIGRRDEQIKIRGHRIEIAEIATAIVRQEGIKDAVIIPVKHSNGEYELAAYFITGEEYNIAQLRERLSQALPVYMIPSYFIPLAEFPLNNNGKLDKHALPQPKDAALSGNGYVPCRNDIDRQVVAVWEAVLERQHIGIRDNFFDLGGHSLKATRVISKLREVFGVQIDLKNLFIEPTVEHLSNYIETIQWMDQNSEVLVNGNDEIIF
jgi:amino acid adenylation domain-containing protein